MKKFLAGLGVFCLLTNSMVGLGVSAEAGTYSLGDVNMDSSVNVLDLLISKKECLGLKEITENRLILGDFNADKAIDARDVLMLKKVLLGLAEAPDEVFELDPSIVGISCDTGSNSTFRAEFDPENDYREASITSYSESGNLDYDCFSFLRTGDYGSVLATTYENSGLIAMDSVGRLTYDNSDNGVSCFISPDELDGSQVISLTNTKDETEMTMNFGCEEYATGSDGSIKVKKEIDIPQTEEVYEFLMDLTADSSTYSLTETGKTSSAVVFSTDADNVRTLSFSGFEVKLSTKYEDDSLEAVADITFGGVYIGSYAFDLLNTEGQNKAVMIGDNYTFNICANAK